MQCAIQQNVAYYGSRLMGSYFAFLMPIKYPLVGSYTLFYLLVQLGT